MEYLILALILYLVPIVLTARRGVTIDTRGPSLDLIIAVGWLPALLLIPTIRISPETGTDGHGLGALVQMAAGIAMVVLLILGSVTATIARARASRRAEDTYVKDLIARDQPDNDGRSPVSS
jgi:hypothetical protein